MDASDGLLDLERRAWQALSSLGTAGPFYSEVLDESPMMLLPGGMVMTSRAEMIEAMSGQPWSSFELEGPRALMLSDSCGIVAYGVVAQRGDGEPYSALMSSTYVKRDGGWRLAFHQQTPR